MSQPEVLRDPLEQGFSTAKSMAKKLKLVNLSQSKIFVPVPTSAAAKQQLKVLFSQVCVTSKFLNSMIFKLFEFIEYFDEKKCNSMLLSQRYYKLSLILFYFFSIPRRQFA